MTRARLLAGTALGMATLAHAKSPNIGAQHKASAHVSVAPPRAWVPPAPPLPMLPAVARVRVEVARDRVIVVQDVSLPRGEWDSGGLDLYVAFGAPGTPIAVDAKLALAHGAGESRPDEAEEVAVEPAARRGPGAQPLLGKPVMAGVVAHVKESQLRRAYAAADNATLRVRSLLEPPAADTQGARDVVVRLGASGGVPLTLERVQLVSLEPGPWVTRAEAHLCGPEADPWPLSIALSPPIDETRPRAPTIAPEMAVRHASDDLCIKWWAGP